MNIYVGIYSFFMVGDDAADKVGIGVPQRGHEFGQRLFVELPHCTKHALLRFVRGAERRLVHSCHLVQAHDPVDWWRGGTERRLVRMKTTDGKQGEEQSGTMQLRVQSRWMKTSDYSRYQSRNVKV